MGVAASRDLGTYVRLASLSSAEVHVMESQEIVLDVGRERAAMELCAAVDIHYSAGAQTLVLVHEALRQQHARLIRSDVHADAQDALWDTAPGLVNTPEHLCLVVPPARTPRERRWALGAPVRLQLTLYFVLEKLVHAEHAPYAVRMRIHLTLDSRANTAQPRQQTHMPPVWLPRACGRGGRTAAAERAGLGRSHRLQCVFCYDRGAGADVVECKRHFSACVARTDAWYSRCQRGASVGCTESCARSMRRARRRVPHAP